MNGPFQFPDDKHIRRHGPRGYADYNSYRPWLRDEFSFRCVYCLVRERWLQLRGLFSIDHFVAAIHAPGDVANYENLLYSCMTCNSAKGRRSLPDPGVTLIATKIEVRDDGTIVGHSRQARRIIRVLGLDSREFVEFRRMWIDVIALARQFHPELSTRLMSFPEDLPDLGRLRPPKGNHRPGGLLTSFHAIRQRGELPAIY